MQEKELIQMNTNALAYLGDGVYELFIRENILSQEKVHADTIHKISVKYVSAIGQSISIKGLLDLLTEEEMGLVRRAKNKKISTKAKNVDVMTYRWATGFEALLGYLYLKKDMERLNFIMSKAKEIRDEQSR